MSQKIKSKSVLVNSKLGDGIVNWSEIERFCLSEEVTEDVINEFLDYQLDYIRKYEPLYLEYIEVLRAGMEVAIPNKFAFFFDGGYANNKGIPVYYDGLQEINLQSWIDKNDGKYKGMIVITDEIIEVKSRTSPVIICGSDNDITLYSPIIDEIINPYTIEYSLRMLKENALKSLREELGK